MFPQWNATRGFTTHPLDEYLDEIAKGAVQGDEITLRCIANVFNGKIRIISTLGNGDRVFIHPENSHPI